MAKPFHHGTVRSWKRGNVLKQDRAWLRLAREKLRPEQPKPEVVPTSLGGDPYGRETAHQPLSDTLAAIADRVSEG